MGALALDRLGEFEQQRFQLGESVLAELRLPVSLDLADSIADRVSGPLATVGESDALRSAVASVGPSLEVPQRLELTEEVVGSLFAHPSSGGELGRTCALRAGVEQEVHMGHVDVIESLGVQPLEHAPHDVLPRHPQKRPDHGRAEVLTCVSKDP